MVSVHPVQGFHFFDPVNMGLSGLNSTTQSSTETFGTAVPAELEDPSKKVRKPYTITKSRENWTDEEHDKFLEALQLFDRDWKKIESFVGSKTVIQIRSHAQKYFLKVQKSGTSEHVPPPRPKRKAAHPYPQKSPKVPATTQMDMLIQSTSTLYKPSIVASQDTSPKLGNTVANVKFSSWGYNPLPIVNISEENKGDVRKRNDTVAPSNCYSSSMESTLKNLLKSDVIDQESHQSAARVMPDFAQVYKFIGSVFDPNASGHLQRLKQLNPINLQTVLALMRNLCVNLTSPEFEEQRRMLVSYNGNPDSFRIGPLLGENSGSPILSA